MTWTVTNLGGRRRVVVTKDLPGDRWREALGRAGCELCISTSREVLSRRAIREAIGDRCDGVIGQLTEVWDAGSLEALARAGGRVYSNFAVGYDNVSVEDATRFGIAVGNTPGVLTETTAELAVALTFAAARRVVEADRFLRAGRFRGWLPDLFLGKRLYRGTLGVVGAGRIGSAYARMMAPAHQMDVLYWDRSDREDLERAVQRAGAVLREEAAREMRVRRAESLDALLRASDVVSLHVPLDDSTHHLIDRRRLRMMRRDAVLVNTSRGPVVDERALVAHLREHPEFRAGLDVFEEEPHIAPGLADLDNVVIVPHIASATVWTRRGMATLAACNVVGVLEGYPLAEESSVGEFLDGDFPRETPSIVNADGLGLQGVVPR